MDHSGNEGVSLISTSNSQLSCVGRGGSSGGRKATDVHETDVLLGRGRGCTGHEGNQRYLSIVEQFAPMYCKANSRNKQNVVKQKVIDAVKPGRFLQPRGDSNESCWVEAPSKVILDKIGQVRYPCSKFDAEIHFRFY